MANTTTTGYPKVVLLDNENNPITPLVDISSIYLDVNTKEDASVLVGPKEDDTYLTTNDIDVNDYNSIIRGAENLYLIDNLNIQNRKIQVEKIDAADLFDFWFQNAYLKTKTDWQNGYFPKTLEAILTYWLEQLYPETSADWEEGTFPSKLDTILTYWFENVYSERQKNYLSSTDDDKLYVIENGEEIYIWNSLEDE